MVITSYPIGLYARSKFFRTTKTVFNAEVKAFLIERMKASSGNLKPLLIIDEATKKSKCYIINETKTDFIEITGDEAKILCMMVDDTAEWQIKRTRVQKSNLSIADKSRACTMYEKRDYNHERLTSREESEVSTIEARI